MYIDVTDMMDGLRLGHQEEHAIMDITLSSFMSDWRLYGITS